MARQARARLSGARAGQPGPQAMAGRASVAVAR